MVCVRSDATSTWTEAGSEAVSRGSSAWMRSTVWTTLAPGCFEMINRMLGAPFDQAASLVFCGPSTAWPMSRTRTGAPWR